MSEVIKPHTLEGWEHLCTLQTAQIVELSRSLSDSTTFQAFFEKHGLGQKMPPSCIVCGRADTIIWPKPGPAIQHGELRGVVVCFPCRDSVHYAEQLHENLEILHDAMRINGLTHTQGDNYAESPRARIVADLLAKNPNPSGQSTAEASSAKAEPVTSGLTIEASGPVGLGPDSVTKPIKVGIEKVTPCPEVGHPHLVVHRVGEPCLICGVSTAPPTPAVLGVGNARAALEAIVRYATAGQIHARLHYPNLEGDFSAIGSEAVTALAQLPGPVKVEAEFPSQGSSEAK